MALSKQNSFDFSGMELECSELTATGQIRGKQNAQTLTASKTLVAADTGTTYFIATDALVMTLPTVASAGAGCTFKFVNSGADGNNIITIDPNGTETIWGTITLAASVVDLGGGAGKKLINTKASSIKGDSVELVCDGSAWFVQNSTGIWAAEA